MIDRDQLREVHSVDLPLHILEQDYVQALFLQELYREADDVAFKGGTFLKHAHGLDRFSEDLDFTRLAPTPLDDVFDETAAALERYALQATIDRVDRRPDSMLARLRYEGPLYDGSDRSRGSVELEVSTRDDVVREPDWRRLFFPYPETRAVTALCLRIEEALAEKLRALSTRTRGRDLYDCWFLLQQGIEIVPDLFEAKMAVVGEPPTVVLSITEREWDRDLSILVEHPPGYQAVKHDIENAILDAGLPFEDDTV